VLFACAVGLYAAGTELPETRQVDLTVLQEKLNGSCTVRWEDPYQNRTREASYRCDSGRSDLLQAPQHPHGHNYGRETGFMLTEGPQRGNLEHLAAGQGLGNADTFLLTGTLLVAVD
jgi:hypothetical protein